MPFIADFHIHSKFSRATAKTLDFEHLYVAAQLKGITVVGTGDFTHPGWFAQICEKLEPAENGLFALRADIAGQCRTKVPPVCRSTVRFMLTAEISNIYKKNGITRKNHNLLFLPDVKSVARFSSRLEKIGNIHSDGRPILGLDARHLLELLLETDPNGFLIPAHIWTPWFSLLGSKSGFDSLQECFEDLSHHIFALETGLSSDPSMNWRVSSLDGLTLISNSDAHSPMKLGREANRFDVPLTYGAIHAALREADPERFLGTIEFFPEEGKYHLDGHRKCGQCLWPEQTRRLDGLCPGCGHPLTRGVLNRVEELADRPAGYRPENSFPYQCLIPLDEVLADIYGVGPNTKRVAESYHHLLERFGSELDILRTVDPPVLQQAGIPLLAEAIMRIRNRQVRLSPGYDGQYGTIDLFDPGEKEALAGQQALFKISPKVNKKIQPAPDCGSIPATGYDRPATPTAGDVKAAAADSQDNDPVLGGLNQQQRRAVLHAEKPLLITAGPGTGKTLTLTRRIAYLLGPGRVASDRILAITFTRKAAREMEQRLKRLLPSSKKMPSVATFHAFCFDMLRSWFPDRHFKVIDADEKDYFLKKTLARLRSGMDLGKVGAQQWQRWIETAKQQVLPPDGAAELFKDPHRAEPFKAVYETYQAMLQSQGFWDFEDLIFTTVRMLENDAALRGKWQQRFTHLLVDEYQDLNHAQYRLVKALSPSGKHLFVIGDPDQSIYGFRGASAEYFQRFETDYPDAVQIRLVQNYRSSQTILDAAHQVIAAQPRDNATRTRLYSQVDGLKTLGIIETATEASEAVAVGKTIEAMLGGTGFHSFDFGAVAGNQDQPDMGFSDFAVLFRTGRQADSFTRMFDQAGIPYQLASREHLTDRTGLREMLALLKLTMQQAGFADLEKAAACMFPNLASKDIAAWVDRALRHGLTMHQALDRLRQASTDDAGSANLLHLQALAANIDRITAAVGDLDVRGKIEHLIDTLRPYVEEAFTQNAAALEQLQQIAAECHYDTDAFLEKIILGTDADMISERAEKVSLLTMHAAKGLEFEVVFVAGCEDRLLPYSYIDASRAQADEERRLFYVAMTRARHRLFLTRARRRVHHGKPVDSRPSPFLEDIENRLKNRQAVPDATLYRKPNRQRQLGLFDP